MPGTAFRPRARAGQQPVSCGRKSLKRSAAPIATVPVVGRAIEAIVAKVAGRVRRLMSRLAASIAESRIHRARLEAELYRGRCRLRTKNDDDLPIIR